MPALAGASVLSVFALGASGVAQTGGPDFSGRWRLVESTPQEREAETLVITAPDELLITDTPLAITIEHPSKRGTHPEAGVFRYGAGGVVGGLPGRGTSLDERWDFSHIGAQLMISRSTTGAPNDRGLRITIARGSMWRLEGPRRLVIEFNEERTGERPKIARRTYLKLPPQ